MLPRPFGVIWVAVLQINPSDLQIYRGLPASFVAGVDESLGVLGVRSVQALPLVGEGVEGMINAVFAAVGMITLFHGSFGIEPLTPVFRQVNQF